MKKTSEVIHVKVPPAEYEQLQEIGRKDKRSMNFLANEAILQFLFWHKKMSAKKANHAAKRDLKEGRWTP